MRADEMLSIELAKVCRTGIKGRPGASPVGDDMERVFEFQRIQLLLVPTQRQPVERVRPKTQDDFARPVPPGPANQPNPRKRPRNNRFKDTPKAETTNQGKGCGKASVMPQAMLGTCASRTKDAQNICFGFNLKTCPHNVKAGTRCPRGMHVCAKLKNGSACGGCHAFSDCA